MIHKEEYDNEAKEVINSISSKIIDQYKFEVDQNHVYMDDGVSKVLVKNTLMIYFFWDYMEAQISWGFQERNNMYGYKIDYRDVFKENSFYHGLKSYRKYCFTEKPSIYWDSFIPKAIEKSFLDYLEKWTTAYSELFETGDYEIIRNLEKRGHQTAESMRIERELIDKLLYEESTRNTN